VSYLIDTNVLSELRRKAPDARVLQWFAQRPAGTLYLSVLTLGEIRKGIESLADPTRRLALLDWLETAGAGWWRRRGGRCQRSTACWPPPRRSTG